MDSLHHAQLQDYARQFDAIKQQARVLVNGMSDEAFNWRPDPERWSVGECLDHLCRTGSLLLPKLDAAVASGRSRDLTGEGPFDYGWLGTWWIQQMQPASRRTFKSPRPFAPSSSALEKEAVVEAFVALQDQLLERLHAADGLDLRRIKAASAALSVFRLSLGAWFESTVAHEQRHLAQARRVVAHAGFPETVS